MWRNAFGGEGNETKWVNDGSRLDGGEFLGVSRGVARLAGECEMSKQ
jgi:hypothetical protein